MLKKLVFAIKCASSLGCRIPTVSLTEHYVETGEPKDGNEEQSDHAHHHNGHDHWHLITSKIKSIFLAWRVQNISS
jgi:hypothetical protein